MNAAAATPDRSWVGVKRIVVLSQVSSSQVTDGDVARDLCDRIARIARPGAPGPVDCVGLGDDALDAAGTSVLIAQGSMVTSPGGEASLLFTIRRDREGGLEPGPIYFGAAPRLARYARPLDGGALDEALHASLGEILPWLRPARQVNCHQLSRRE